MSKAPKRKTFQLPMDTDDRHKPWKGIYQM